MKIIDLNGIWGLRGRRQTQPSSPWLALDATVPGCVQLDLSSAGYLPEDLFMGENILQTEKYEDYEWIYERTFTAPAERKDVYLVFEGVDCVAEYYLNDHLIGKSENMFIAHEFEVGAHLRDGENTVKVHIFSPVIAAHELDYPLSSLKAWSNAPVQTGIRRAPHSYGWDIMPRAVTSGLWRGVRLEVRDAIRFSQLYCQTGPRSCEILFELEHDYALSGGIEVVFSGQCGEDSTFEQRCAMAYTKHGRLSLSIKNPKTWWPYGYGEANVYDATARIYKDGELVHEQAFSFGLRSAVLDRTDTTDGKNGRFRFLVNGTEIMCRGSNWVPMDAFHSRDAERYADALALVKDIGCNIVRCWGGNVYEDHAFFDFCDRNGIMVWQDFAMACRNYPQDDRFKALITQEATAVVRKLRNHPCIVLWSGDNEVDEMMMGQGLDPANNSITRRWLPDVIWQNDWSRSYLPSSPYVSEAIFRQGDRTNIPENHLWGPRDYYKSSYYKDSKAHFVSETGYHGCPSLESIKKFITPERVWPYANNPEWILHSSDQHGRDHRVMLMEKQIRQLFGTVPTDPEEYILASQISQAEAKKYMIERMRLGRPHKTGIIWWNLLDGWPQMSDAVVDYYYCKKLAYYYIKRAQAPFSIAVDELANWSMRVCACNDTLIQQSGHVTIKDAETDELLYDADFTARPNVTTPLTSLPIYYSEQRVLIIEWTVGEQSGRNHHLCGFPPFDLPRYKAILKKHKLGE